MKQSKQLTFIDLFAGVGGFRMGMEKAGHKCVGFCEFDKYARQSYKAIFNTENEVECMILRGSQTTLFEDSDVWTLSQEDFLTCDAFLIEKIRH